MLIANNSETPFSASLPLPGDFGIASKRYAYSFNKRPCLSYCVMRDYPSVVGVGDLPSCIKGASVAVQIECPSAENVLPSNARLLRKPCFAC